MPSYLSYILQLLNIGYFLSIKTAYRREAKNLIYSQIKYITKLKFLLYFKAAFFNLIIESNIQRSFRGAKLVLFNLEAVILKLNIRLKTLILLLLNKEPQKSKTLSNTLEIRFQLTLVKIRIQRYLNSLLTLIVKAFKKLTKGVAIIAYKLALA